MKPTPQQAAILSAITDPDVGNLAVIARAGSGKTSTIIMALSEIAEHDDGVRSIVVCAFNKAIATEMKEKTTKLDMGYHDLNVATIHSLGFAMVRAAYGKVKMENYKVYKIVDEMADAGDAIVMANKYPIVQLVGFAKKEGVGYFDDTPIDDDWTWERLALHYDVRGFEVPETKHLIFEAARRVYQASLNDTETIDFDDMILFPLLKDLHPLGRADYLFIDEAQDLSRVRQALLERCVKPDGRTIVVGDDKQAIYGFAGADDRALQNMMTKLDCTRLPLTVSWRCPVSVIELARTIVPDIDPAPEAKPGAVETASALPERPTPKDAILCRNTAPLISAAYHFIKHGIACKVEGRDIGKGLVTLAKRWKTDDADTLLHHLDEYEAREETKLINLKQEYKVEALKDKCATLRIIADTCITDGNPTVSAIVNFIESLFSDDVKGITTLATYHRAKGREWPTVYLLDHHSRCPSRWAKQDWQVEQEHNLAYVAFTRSQDQLIFVGN